MSDIDVEAVESLDGTDLPVDVDAPEYVLYGGKGGVGKTTMAAATALASARGGTPTLIASTDPAHSLSDTFETAVPAEPGQIHDDVPLYAVEIDPEAAGAGLFGSDGGPFSADDAPGQGLFERLLGDTESTPLSVGAMPGTDEAAAIQLMVQYLDDDRFDRVVIDTAPTGHTLRLLELPETLDTLVGRLLTLRERLQGLADNIPGTAGGEYGDSEGGVADLHTVRERIERLRSTLRDPARTDFRVVMVPEEMSIRETERLLDRLDAYDIPVGTIVVNRVIQDLAEVADVEADWFVAPSVETCEFCRRRWDAQRDALALAHDLFRDHEVKRVPLFADDVRGEAMLDVVAACLD